MSSSVVNGTAGLDEAALRERIDACEYLIGLDYEVAHHESMRDECVVALEKLLSPQEDHKERALAYTHVELLGSLRRRLLRPWEFRLGLDKPYVGEEDEFYYITLHGRPQTRADCEKLPRPCPFVGCRHHLWMEVSPRSRDIKPNHKEQLPWEMKGSTCSLDVVEDNPDGMTLLDIGAHLGVSRERIRQVEEILLQHILTTMGKLLWEGYFPLDNAPGDDYGEEMPDKVRTRLGIK